MRILIKIMAKLLKLKQKRIALRRMIESTFMHHWMHRRWLAYLLLPISCLLGVLITFRRKLYTLDWLKSTRLPVPVLVVGNIFLGGTGKTPLTIFLLRALQQAGYKPGVISRGYGTDNANNFVRHVSNNSIPGLVGDEPLLIVHRTQCPVVVGRDRAAAGHALLAAHPDVNVIISDDGLQHYALQRDIEIVLFDTRGGGNGYLLPAGPLREPMTRKSDFVVLNATQNEFPALSQSLLKAMNVQASHFACMQLIGQMAERLSDRSEKIPLSTLINHKDKTITAVAGIGNPARFFAMLRNAGLSFQEVALPDHYDFAADSFDHIQADIILMTEKDAVKCVHFASLKNDSRLWVVPVTACIEDAWIAQILEKLGGCQLA